MSLRVTLSREAEADLAEAVDWYEEWAGRGADFVARVRAVLKQIGDFPDRSPIVFPSVRRALIRRTPYGVYYRVHPDHVEVLAVYHGRRDPSGWQGRL